MGKGGRGKGMQLVRTVQSNPFFVCVSVASDGTNEAFGPGGGAYGSCSAVIGYRIAREIAHLLDELMFSAMGKMHTSDRPNPY